MLDITLKTVLRHLVTSLGTILTVAALGWTIAKPHAEDFIRETVQMEKFASQQSLNAIDSRTANVESIVEELRRSQDVAQSDMRTLKELQTETRRDVRSILLGIRRLNEP